MRYSPSEKLEMIRIVEDSDLSFRKILKELGIHRSTFYNWYRRYLEDGVEGLGPKNPKKRSFWNKIPVEVKEQVVQQALDQTELLPRELACRITDTKEYFISEPSVYRILKSHDLITSPAYILMQAGDSFKNPTRLIHELWQIERYHRSMKNIVKLQN
jgi:putative transposase